MFLTLFQFLTWLLTYKHLKIFSKYLVGQNWTMWKTFFFISSKCEKKISRKQTKRVTGILLTVRSRVWRTKPLLTWWAYKRQKFTLISIKILRNFKFFLQLTGYLNTRNSFPICMFVVMAWGKCDLHIHFTFLQDF